MQSELMSALKGNQRQSLRNVHSAAAEEIAQLQQETNGTEVVSEGKGGT